MESCCRGKPKSNLTRDCSAGDDDDDDSTARVR
jgi:hypothetical protein